MMAAGGWRVVFFKVWPLVHDLLQWMPPHPEVYEQHKLESMDYKKGVVGWVWERGGVRKELGEIFIYIEW